MGVESESKAAVTLMNLTLTIKTVAYPPKDTTTNSLFHHKLLTKVGVSHKMTTTLHECPPLFG